MMTTMITLLATHHANKRARERFGWHRDGEIIPFVMTMNLQPLNGFASSDP